MKRWPLPTLLCLLLGAVTTVAVAWACVMNGQRLDRQLGDLPDLAHHELAEGIAKRLWGPARVDFAVLFREVTAFGFCDAYLWANVPDTEFTGLRSEFVGRHSAF